MELHGISESTQSQEQDPQEMLDQMTSLFDEFTGFIEALGLSAGQDENGNELLTVGGDMLVLGETMLNDVTVTGDLVAGLMRFDTLESSIDILGPACYNPTTGEADTFLCESQTLYLQKSLAGNIDLLDGTVVITPEGLVTIDGEIRAEKYSVASPALDNASAGKSVILAGETIITVNTTALNDNSLIFVTPDTPVLLGTKKTGPAEFEITLNDPEASDIVVSWWIVDSFDQLTSDGSIDTIATGDDTSGSSGGTGIVIGDGSSGGSSEGTDQISDQSGTDGVTGTEI
jgi:hypothetical protein